MADLTASGQLAPLPLWARAWAALDPAVTRAQRALRPVLSALEVAAPLLGAAAAAIAAFRAAPEVAARPSLLLPHWGEALLVLPTLPILASRYARRADREPERTQRVQHGLGLLALGTSVFTLSGVGLACALQSHALLGRLAAAPWLPPAGQRVARAVQALPRLGVYVSLPATAAFVGASIAWWRLALLLAGVRPGRQVAALRGAMSQLAAPPGAWALQLAALLPAVGSGAATAGSSGKAWGPALAVPVVAGALWTRCANVCAAVAASPAAPVLHLLLSFFFWVRP